MSEAKFIMATNACKAGVLWFNVSRIDVVCKHDKEETKIYVSGSDNPFWINESPDEIFAMIEKVTAIFPKNWRLDKRGARGLTRK